MWRKYQKRLGLLAQKIDYLQEYDTISVIIKNLTYGEKVKNYK